MSTTTQAMRDYRENIRCIAQRELDEEKMRADVATEKVRILERRNRSLWQRLTARLPFTFTFHRKSK